jgi:membrane fusion protein, multidrug efflux system
MNEAQSKYAQSVVGPSRGPTLFSGATHLALAAALLALPSRDWAQTGAPAAAPRPAPTFQSAVATLAAKTPPKPPNKPPTEKALNLPQTVQALPAPAAVAAVATVAAPAPSSAEDAVRVLLIPSLDTTLSSPVAGRIRLLESALGASFGDGAVLITFDCEEATARLNMGKAELAGAVETHEGKLRLQGLEQAAEVDVALAAAAVAKARAQIELGKAQVAQCKVTAPWAGRVAKVHVRNHMSVSAGQPLLDLVKTGPLKLKLSVPSRWLTRMKPGVDFAVAIDETGKVYEARVQALNSRIDPVSQTIEIEAVMTRQYPELLAGMSGTAQFGAARK